jgi:signal transduction histidine kinase/sugar lactone lactonase YvrE
MEMGDDSVWVITNSTKINGLVKGKMKLLSIHDDGYIINNLCKDANGDIYAAAEEGVLVFNKEDRFIKLPFVDANGVDVSSYISFTFSVGDYLLVQRDNSMLPTQNEMLYLYNKITKKITAEIPGIYAVQVAKDGRTWLSTEKNIMAVNTAELARGKLVLQELPQQFAQLTNKGKYFIIFDNENNCWLGNQRNVLIKASADGIITSFDEASGLKMLFVNSIFKDREGITWIATNNTGVSKLVHTNFSHIEKPFDIVNASDISYHNESLLIYSFPTNTAVIIHNNEKKYLHVKDATTFTKLIKTPNGFFGIDRNIIYRVDQAGDILYPKAILSDSSGNIYPNMIVDMHGNVIVPGKYHLTAVINGKIIFKTRIPFFADIPATDSKGNIWIATRANELLMFKTHPEDPSNYLEQKFFFKKELAGISPRSIIIDKNDNIWIGTRNHGIHVYSMENGKLIQKFVLTPAQGLSDEFTSHLTCDAENSIWASSALGLDKVTIKNGVPVVENITKQNNIYQSVFTIVSDKDNNVWGLVSNGVIKITPERKEISNYSPTLMVSMLKAGKDTINNGTSLSYRQNNLSFNFTATSFLNEKQVMYSYRLQGGTNNQWSESSNNTTVSFIDLPPGDYALDIKANFPAGRYAEQSISYKFSIIPAWWQTWLFKSFVGLLIIGLLIIGFRFYYRRKLEKKMAMLEKQQAIEKERTRIATDMHDDLGAGLSRIKFLSETIGIKKQQHEPIEEDVNKIRQYSHEMIDKMGEIVWALNEKNDSLSDLLSYTRAYTMEYLAQNGIDCKTQMPDNFPTVFVSGEFRRNIFLTIKEALHNVVKHSQATEVKLTININHHLTIKLKDNGTGFDQNNIRLFSNGLSNMESRVKEIGGKIEILNKQGTLVNLSIPLNS